MVTGAYTGASTRSSGGYRVPDWLYVSSLYNVLQYEMQGAHSKLDEIERLKYYEDDIQVPQEQRNSGKEVRVGLTAELLENIKAALLANRPKVRIKALRKHRDAPPNAENREKYWQAHLDTLFGGDSAPNTIADLTDALLLGLGVLKSGYAKSRWDRSVWKKKRGESTEDHLDRVVAYKKLWGHPTAAIQPSMNGIFCRPGDGAKIEELIEHSWKPRITVMTQYNLGEIADKAGEAQLEDSLVATVQSQPENPNRMLPQGVDTTAYVEVYEYWNPQCYQVWVNHNLVYEEVGEISVSYFMAPGRSTSSKDPDKYALSPAENLRHNEPVINGLITQMVEATDLIVHRRNTLEVPESYVPEFDQPAAEDKDGTPRPRTWSFREDYVEALPAGSKLRDAFDGVGAAYGVMPLVQLLLSITAEHGVSPLFKGISPGAAGSGYRDNSLYSMAKAQFEYIIKSLQGCLVSYIRWQEWLLVHVIKEEVYEGEYRLRPRDIEDFPASITVELKPEIPQNLIANGEFWSRQQQMGNVSRRYAREQGLEIEQPMEMQEEVDFERLQEMLLPMLYQDVLMTTLGRPVMQDPTGGTQSGLVGPDGKPINSQSMLNQSNAGANGAGREIGQQNAGRATGGQPRQPAREPADGAQG